MRLEQLQAFLKVAELGSFQQAALQSEVTQSTISRQIQGLESALKCQLFHRGAQAKLTVAGELFLRRARKICQEWDVASEEISSLFQGKQTELCVAAIHSVCVSSLPSLLPKFCLGHPQIQLRVTALGSDRALKVLQDGLVDVAIIMSHRNLTNTKELAIKPLYEEQICILMASDHPLTAKKFITWENLGPYPQVIFKDGYRMRRLVEDEFSRREIPLNVSLELNIPEAFYGVVQGSEMIALMPQSLVTPVIDNPNFSVRYLFCPESGDRQDFRRQVSVVTTVDRLQIPPVAEFFNLVVDHYRCGALTVK
jgi:DNA-binding transcriptional LysR family regulator